MLQKYQNIDDRMLVETEQMFLYYFSSEMGTKNVTSKAQRNDIFNQ